ncbi:type II secretion system minor pseudopilin GspI [Tsuneonella sp. HG222]
MNRAVPAEQGFTLIEAMVALVILGIASVGIVRAVEAHVDRLGQMEVRASAQMVAENALAEARLGILSAGTTDQRMLNRNWRVSTKLDQSADPDMWLATVEVSDPASGAAMATMRGFVDKGTITPP